MDNIQRRMQQVTKTAEQWESENPILAEGLIGVVKETGRMKAGDGVKHWNELKFEMDYFPTGEYMKQISAAHNKPFLDGNYYRNTLSFQRSDQAKVVKRYIYFGDISICGAVRISATSVWWSGNPTGLLTKEIHISTGGGAINSQTSKYTSVGADIKERFAISDLAHDNEKGYYLYVEESVDSKNPLFITIEIFANDGGLLYLSNKTLITEEVIADNKTLEKPEYSLGNTGQFVYKDFGSPSTQAALDATIDNIKDFNYVGRIAPSTNGLSLPGYQGLIIGQSEPEGAYQTQLYMSYDFGCLMRRFKWNGGWHPWTKIIEMTDMPSAINSYNGYFKLPTGLILQYGFVTNATPEGLQVTWPVAITRVPMSPIVTPEVNGEAIGYYAYSYATSSNKNNFKLHSNCPGVSWMCITQ